VNLSSFSVLRRRGLFQHARGNVVGFLRNTSAADSAGLLAAFRKGLNETGFVEGQTVAIEYRWAESRYDRLPGGWRLISSDGQLP
jgi:hypothetical protein